MPSRLYGFVVGISFFFFIYKPQHKPLHGKSSYVYLNWTVYSNGLHDSMCRHFSPKFRGNVHLLHIVWSINDYGSRANRSRNLFLIDDYVSMAHNSAPFDNLVEFVGDFSHTHAHTKEKRKKRDNSKWIGEPVSIAHSLLILVSVLTSIFFPCWQIAIYFFLIIDWNRVIFGC